MRPIRVRRSVVALLLLALITTCGGSSDEPTVPAADNSPERTPTLSASPTVDSSEASPTRDATASDTTVVTNGGYELVARWGEPAPLVLPIGVAVLSDGSIAVADNEGSRITIYGSDGAFETSWTAEGIWGLSAGPDGQLYTLASRNGTRALVYDRKGELVRELDIPPAATSGESQMNVTDMTVASDGSIYVTSGVEAGTGVGPAPFAGVLKLGPTGGEQARWPTPPGVQPQHIAVDDDGMVAVVLTPTASPTAPSPGPFPGTLVRFDAESGPPSDWIDAEIALSREIEIDALTSLPDGLLLAVDAAGINPNGPDTTTLYRIDPMTGAVEEIVALGDGLGASPIGASVAVDESGEILLADAPRNRVLRFNPAGDVVGELGGIQPGQLASPEGADLGPDGRLYVYDPTTAQVVIFERDGSMAAAWDVPLDHPFGLPALSDIAVRDNGTVVVTHLALSRTIVLSPDGEVIDEWTPPFNQNPEQGEPQIFDPDRIAMFDEWLYVTIMLVPIIATYSLDGEFIDTWPVEFLEALDVTATDDAVYALVAVASNEDEASPTTTRGNRDVQVQRLVGGDVEVIATIDLGNLEEGRPDFFPYRFTVAPDGSIFLTDPFTRQIRTLDAEGNTVAHRELPPDANAEFGSSLSLEADETRLYVTDSASRQVLVYEATE